MAAGGKSSGLQRRQISESSQQLVRLDLEYSLAAVAEQVRTAYEAGAASSRTTIRQLEDSLQHAHEEIKSLHVALRERDSLAIASLRIKSESKLRKKVLKKEEEQTKELVKLFSESRDKVFEAFCGTPPEVQRAIAAILGLPDELKDEIEKRIGNESWKALYEWARK